MNVMSGSVLAAEKGEGLVNPLDTEGEIHELVNPFATDENGVTPRGSYVPTSLWVLSSNNYRWSAYINGYRLYSAYYFQTNSPHRFRIFGTKRYAISTGYYVEIYNWLSGGRARTYVSKDASGLPDFSFYDTDVVGFFEYGNTVVNNASGDYYYFGIDGSSTGCAASLDGEFDTW